MMFLFFSRRVAKGASTMNTPLDSVLLPAENPATPFCRICLEEDGEMISPCQCTGTLAHVHEPCLRQWRDQFDPCDERALRCQQCTAPYHIQYILPRNYMARRQHRGNMILCGVTASCIATICFEWGGPDRNLEAIFMALSCTSSMVLCALSWRFDTGWAVWMALGLFVGTVVTFMWVYTSVLYAPTIMGMWQFVLMPFVFGFGTTYNVRNALERPPPDDAFVVFDAR